jgi:hypothetical protein
MTMSKHDSIAHTLVSAVSAGASFTVSYPSGKSADDYLGGSDHMIVTHTIRTLFAKSGDFSVAFGASNITVTMASGLALPAGAVIYLNVDRAERDDPTTLADTSKMAEMTLVKIGLGAPATADADGVCASQALNTGVDGVIAGALAADGVATFDKPRNVVAAWTNAAVITVTGTDEYGETVVESSASGTSFTGKKAFKTVTQVRVSANVTGLTVGSGVVLGLPCFLADVADVVKEIMDGVAPTAGTFVAGDNTTATATTGDVRGTLSPNSAPNGSRVYEVIAAVRSAAYTGAAQYAG